MKPPKKNIVFELKTLDHLIKKTIEARMRQEDCEEQLTRMHHWIIGYLFDHSNAEVFQRDIETEFKISRSTTSSMLSLMERKGLITREGVKRDARLKKLSLTDKAIHLHKLHIDNIIMIDKLIDDSITPIEKAEFLRIIEKLGDAMRTPFQDDTQPE